jgi:DNA gyrase subunit A
MKKTHEVTQQITETLEVNYMPYAMSVIVSRAIPEIDGFKPSHRKLLYTMYKMNLLKGSKTKSANVVGSTMKLNPHGDQAIYETLVRLTRGHDALLHAYIDSKGNFGKVTSRDMRFAASRYTEVKLDGICEELFKDIDKETVDFMDNYDGKMKEPTLLPTTFPNILVNSNKGIAVGMASSIPSFNLREMCAATIAFMENPAVDLINYIPAPDFSTGGRLLHDVNAMADIYESGGGSFRIRAKYCFNAKHNAIEITEIPYTTTVEAIIDKIIDLLKNGKIKDIVDVRDETGLMGLRITLDLKKGTDPEKIMTRLFQMTPLEDSFSCNFNLLVSGRPKVLGIKKILTEWLRFRVDCIQRQLRYDIQRMGEKLHLLKALDAVLLDIDKAIAIIRQTDLEKQVIPNLMAAFSIDQIQAEYVADIKLRNLNKEYLINRIKEMANLEKEIDQNRKVHDSQMKIYSRIKHELEAVSKQYGVDRKTELVHKETIVTHTEHQLIEDYNLKLFFTDHNYLKKVSLVSLRASSNQKLKDDDFIVQEIDGTNLSDIILFSDKQNAYKMKAYEMEDHKASDFGAYLPNIVDLEPDERILYVVVTTDYNGFMIFAYDNGKLSKIPMSQYATKTNRKRLIKAYSDQSPIVRILHAIEDIDLVLTRTADSHDKRVLMMNSELIPEKTTRNTIGIQCFRMKQNSYLSSCKLKDEVYLAGLDQYRVKSIPIAGVALDLMEKMNNPDL